MSEYELYVGGGTIQPKTMYTKFLGGSAVEGGEEGARAARDTGRLLCRPETPLREEMRAEEGRAGRAHCLATGRESWLEHG